MLSAAAPHQRLVGRAMRNACPQMRPRTDFKLRGRGLCALLSFECCYPLGASIRPRDQQRSRAVGCASYATAAANNCASLHRFLSCAKRLELAACKALANRSRQDPIRQMSSLDPDDAWDNGQLRTRVSICFQFQQRRPALREWKKQVCANPLQNPRSRGCPTRPRESVKRCLGSTRAPVTVTPKSFHSG